MLTTGALVSRATYDALRAVSVIPEMVPPTRAVSIIFGTTQAGTQEPVIGEVRAPGRVLDLIRVVRDLTMTLVGDATFSR